MGKFPGGELKGTRDLPFFGTAFAVGSVWVFRFSARRSQLDARGCSDIQHGPSGWTRTPRGYPL